MCFGTHSTSSLFLTQTVSTHWWHYKPYGVQSTGFISVQFHVYTRICQHNLFPRSIRKEDRKNLWHLTSPCLHGTLWTQEMQMILMQYRSGSRRLRLLVTGLWLWRPKFSPEPVHVSFMADSVVVGQLLHLVLWFSPVSVIPPLLHIYSSFVCHWGYIVLGIS
jgi:hypothetical protein